MSTGPADARISSLQQERSRETRRKLVAAGTRLWLEQGFDETTVADICAAAGVAKGTFYFYFPSKEFLLIELSLTTSDMVDDELDRLVGSDRTTRDLLDTILERLARRTAQMTKELLLRIFTELYRHVGDWSVIRQGRTDLRAIFHRILVRGQERGEVRTDRDPDELANVLTTVVIHGMVVWARGDASGTLARVLKQRVALVTEGIAS